MRQPEAADPGRSARLDGHVTVAGAGEVLALWVVRDPHVRDSVLSVGRDKTPVRAAKANAIAERFVGTIRRGCFDWLLILNRRHLQHVLCVFADHDNAHRPHRSLDLTPPEKIGSEARVAPFRSADVKRRDRLGGLVHEYSYAA